MVMILTVTVADPLHHSCISCSELSDTQYCRTSLVVSCHYLDKQFLVWRKLAT